MGRSTKKVKAVEAAAEAVPPEDRRGIDATLAALSIDKGDTAEEAAVAAVSPVVSSVVVEEVEGAIQVPEPVSGSIPEEEEAGAVVEVESPLLDPMLPPPPEDVPALVPSPQPARSKKREAAKGATARVGKALASKVPGAESVKIYKRKEDGKKWYVGCYTVADLSSHDSFETFLTEYVKPKHGSGEYVLTAPDKRDHTKEYELGTVRLLGTPDTSDQGMAGVLQTLLTQTQSRDADWLERMEKQMAPQPQQNPIDLLKGVMDLSERVNGKAGVGEAAAKVEAANTTQTMMEVMQASGDKGMQMMMLMMQQQAAASDRQMQMMMAMFNKPKEEDPTMKLLLAKLVNDESGGGNALLPPPPPPPPQMNMVDMLTAVTGLLAATQGGGDGGGGDDFKEYLIAQQTAKAGDSLSMKDMVELLTRKDGSKGDGFKDAVDNMAAIMNITQNVSRQNEGGPAAGLFDALAALFSNRDFAGAIANTIRAKTDQSGSVQKTGIDMAQQRLAMQQRLALRQQQQQALLAAQQQGAAAGGTPLQQQAAGAPQQVITPAPAPTPLESVEGPPVRLVQPAPITDAQARSAEATAKERQLPELPSDTHTHINNIATAKDDAERVERTVRMLIYFSEFDEWRVFVEQILGFIRDGKRGETMKYLSALFEGFAAIHLIDPTLGMEVLRTIDEHFGVLQDHLHEFELESDKMITGDDLLHAPGGSVAAGVISPDGDEDLGEKDGDPGEEGEEGGEDGGDPGENDGDLGEEGGEPEPA